MRRWRRVITTEARKVRRPRQQLLFGMTWAAGMAMIATACMGTSVITEGTLEPAADDAATPAPAPAPTPEANDDAAVAAEPATSESDLTDSDEATATEASAADAAESAPIERRAERDAAALFGIGSQDQLDRLADDCADGSDLACDILFQASARNSPEEALALSCAGRGSGGSQFCTDGIDADGDNIWFSDGSPGLVDVVDACRDGNMTACDFLYYRSAVGSTYEDLGNTCAERIDVALPDCRTAFPNS